MKNNLIIMFIAAVILCVGCKKYLEEKQDSRFAIPQSLTDMQMLLDHYTIMNTGYPYQSEVAADNYYLTTADYNALTDANMRDFHTWVKNDQRSQDWYNMYRIILHANTVIENADGLAATAAEKEQAARLVAAARFYRGNSLFALAQLYAVPYAQAADAVYGLPLKQSSDALEPVVRSTVHQTYQYILSDLLSAASGLDTVKPYPNRPTKTAAFAALARCYLAMQNYPSAAVYADSALMLKSDLIQFSTLSTTAANPFPRFNKEVIFPAVSSTATALVPARAKVDTTLIQGYIANDLRRSVFFKQNANGSWAFKGDYNASNNGLVFLGYTTSELYLTKAEAMARTGNVPAAMAALNSLLRTRWRPNTYIDFTAATPQQALAIILAERRKELVFRGQRWSDLRRLNAEAATQTTLTRLLNSQVITLPPQAAGYTLQLPASVIQLSNLPQNP